MTKEIRSSNFQNPNGALRRRVGVITATTHWDLVIGHSLDIVFWTLDICGFAALRAFRRASQPPVSSSLPIVPTIQRTTIVGISRSSLIPFMPDLLKLGDASELF